MRGERMQARAISPRLRMAELTSAVGAGVLGLGAGVLVGHAIPGLGMPLLVVGLLLHAWGMTDKHRIEAGAAIPAWSRTLYWVCWALLVVLAIYAVISVLR
jgi:hypothetical protein